MYREIGAMMMPKKRTLPYVLLGLINAKGQLSGYQMVQEFKHEISDFWTASHSQIYPELQRMVDDKWIQIVSPISHQNTNRNQTYYALTPIGHAVLLDWLQEPLTAKNDDLFPLKLFFIKTKDSNLLRPLLTQQLALSQNRVTYLKKRKAMVFQTEADIAQHYGHYLTLSRGIERETNYVLWLEKLLSKI